MLYIYIYTYAHLGDVGKGKHEIEALKATLIIRRTNFKELTILVGERGTLAENIEWTLRLATKRPNATSLRGCQGMHVISVYFENSFLLLLIKKPF